MVKVVNGQWSNVNCEKDVMYALMWSRWILRILGVWPFVYPDVSITERILTTITFTVCWTLLNFLLVPMMIFMLSDETSIYDKVKMLGPMGYVVMSMMKYFFLTVRCRNIRRCIRTLRADWRAVEHEDHRKIMLKSAAKGHVLSKFSIVFIYCGGLCYHTLMPFLAHDQNGERNVSVNMMPYPGFDLVFDLEPMSTHIIVFGAQWCSGIILFNITTAVCCLAAIFVAHACGQIGIVMARVESFVKDVHNNRACSKRHMATIIKQHVQTLKFSNNIEDVFREICLVEVMASIVIICLLEYYCMMEWNNNDNMAILTYFFLLIAFVFNVFMFCYISEQLTEQCGRIGHTSFEIDWYRLPGKIALDFILMIGMSHQPKKITAGNIINLSYSSFGTVLKTSIAYFNLLRTVVT